MRIVLTVLLTVLVLLTLLCWMRVGVTASFAPLCLRLRVGPLRLQVFPPKKRTEGEEKAKQERPRKKSAQPMVKPSLADIKDAVRTLAPPLKRALERLGRGITVSPLELSILLGGEEDPAEAAERYGYLQELIWTGMPLLERMVRIKNPHIHSDIDFDAPLTRVEGQVGVSLRVGTVLVMGLGVGMPALGWLLRYQKKNRQRPTAEKAADGNKQAA